MRRFALFILPALAALLPACESTDSTFDPNLVEDSVTLAAPTAGVALPSALDVITAGTELHAGRFPERILDATEWDLALRVVGGQLVFLPAGVVGLSEITGGPSRAAITEARTGRTFDQVTQAPGAGSFITDRGVPLRQGEVYVVRSRLIPCVIGPSERYAKIQALEVDAARQQVRLRILANESCADQRLAEED